MHSVEPSSRESESLLCDLLGCLRALRHLHQTAHWTVTGETFHGDHLLFERLYESVDAEIDALAEKSVAYFDEESVDLTEQLSCMLEMSRRWESATDCIVSRSLVAEEHLQSRLAHTYNRISDRGEMSLGLDDFLMGVAHDHEAHVYLLRQKVRCDCDAC